MKGFLRINALILLLFASQQRSNAQSNHSIIQFEFMLGHWQMKTSSGSITESWKKAKGSMMGKSYRYGKEVKPVLTESVELKLIDGILNYIVTGFEEGNKGRTSFKLISNEGNKFVFENKENDFPQRIIYQYKDKNSLLAWIEGMNNGKEMKISFPYQRVH